MHRISDEDLNDLVEQIASAVYGNSTIAAIRRQLGRFVPADILEAAITEYQSRAGRPRDLHEPRSLTDPAAQLEPWYIPRSDDVFWPAVRRRLEGTGLDDEPIRRINDASSKIVSFIPPPGTELFSSRGLVLGHVQSGKTTNFMSVAAKLCDARYRFVVVLSGITDNLRSQTQQRLEQILVGDDRGRWHLLTDGETDFDDRQSRNAANLLSNPDQRLLAVVKKNPYRLRKLARFLEAAGTILQDCPILVIDDEADQASIDVGNRGRQSTINSLIRRILSKPKVAYVAYTATPFANLLIDPSVPDDLYPADFIVDLPRSDDYFGAERIFGRDLLTYETGPVDRGLDVVRTVPDGEIAQVRPPGARAGFGDWRPTVTDSLGDAIRWFILATAARRCRDGAPADSTMLIHTSMRAPAHQRTAEVVQAYLGTLRSGWSTPAVRERFRHQWEQETTRVPATDLGLSPVPWPQVCDQIPGVMADVGVVVDNYQSDVRLSYGEEPVTAIAIGGNTLSRGLTLVGLVCSYFVRAASAYDTLLQMGRWFGYRHGYEDLPRIWMTGDLAAWFVDLATVEAEIRQQIRRYETEHKTPRQLAVMIRKHPAMAVTSAAKMRGGVTVRYSYGSQVMQTIKFHHRDQDWLRHNINAADRLLTAARNLPGVRETPVRAGRTALTGVPAARVMAFLRDYRFHERSPSLRPEALCEYIAKQNDYDALRTWNVVVIEQGSDRLGTMELAGRKYHRINRSRLTVPADYADIKALVSTMDRVADLPASIRISDMIDGDPTDRRLRELRDGQLGGTGLLCLYPVSRNSTVERSSGTRGYPRTDLAAVEDILGIGLFFPEARGPEDRDYVAVDLSGLAPVDEELEIVDIDEIDAADERAGEAVTDGAAS